MSEPLSREAWGQRYLDEHGYLRAVPGNGSVPGQRVSFSDMPAFLDAFPAQVDRLGAPDGEFLTILGGNFDQRAQLPSDVSARLHRYEFTGDLPTGWSIELGTNAPLFGRGGGARYVVVRSANGVALSVFELLDVGVLRVVDA